MGIKSFLRDSLHHDRNMRVRFDELQYNIETFKTQHLIWQLRNMTLNSHEPGVAVKRFCEHEVIVSLTTFSNRIDNVYLPIESIMQGSVKPNRIILWLSQEEYKDTPIPQTLKLQQERGLEIKYCTDFLSYNKLIHTLAEYPEAAIITIDDDVVYEYDLVERLVNAHNKNPKSICACRMHRIVLDKANNPVSYMDWNLCIDDTKTTPLNFPTGVGGVLYPPHCFTDEVFNNTIFMELCPKADDIWFYAMALLGGTSNQWVATEHPKGYYQVICQYTNSLSFSNTNTQKCENDIQLRKVFDKYNLWEKLI